MVAAGIAETAAAAKVVAAAKTAGAVVAAAFAKTAVVARKTAAAVNPEDQLQDLANLAWLSPKVRILVPAAGEASPVLPKQHSQPPYLLRRQSFFFLEP